MTKTMVLIILILSITHFKCNKQDFNGRGNGTSNETLEPTLVYNLNISEPSGIAYNPANDLFMIVSDNENDIFLIDSVGNIIGTIPTSSSDMEGITLSKNCDTLFVVEESNRMVVAYNNLGTRLSTYSVDVATHSEHALEGIARNTINQHLIILNEKLPCMLLEYENLKEVWRKEIKYTSDISDISFDEQSNCWWVVSDESQKILKLNMNMDIISAWMIPINHAEGITIIKNKIYIVSDAESKMYVFQKPV